MPRADAERWDARYAAEMDSWLARSPRQLLQNHAHLLPQAGLALDAAAGVATNSLYLAERGLQVVALDISEVALRSARVRFARHNLSLAAAVLDLAHLWLPAERFEVIVNFHFLERATLPVYRDALKPGGILYFETFILSPPETRTPNYYLKHGELAQAFNGFNILHQAECLLEDETGVVIRRTEQLIARKPTTGTTHKR